MRGGKSNPSEHSTGTNTSQTLFENRIKAFERAWLTGPVPLIEDFLAEVSDPQQLLVELVHIDLEFRLKGGMSVRVEDYLARYPQLQENRPALLELIAAEFELRRRYHRIVGLSEYLVRFPDHAHEALGEVLRSFTAEGPTILGGTVAAYDDKSTPCVPGYEVLGVLGRGGMGVVYRARDLVLGRQVAIKFLPTEYARDHDRLERFRKEARTTSALNHPHICTVHTLGEQNGRPFIVMELIEGRTLKELTKGEIGLPSLCRLIGQAARALAVAHAAGVVHRDIKPENIMVREDGYVKVLDFGLARHLPELAKPIPGVGPGTDPGALLGTVAYMSPEQAQGHPVESATDIFSLGVVLYQLATREHPFKADSPLAMLQAITSHFPVSPGRLNSGISSALESLIESMLHKAPRLRPTAAEVETALSTFSDPDAGWNYPRSNEISTVRPTTGRKTELALLYSALVEAEAGRGNFLCVAGEPGIGKTTLVEEFLREISEPRRGYLVARGRCSERLAGAEAYLPVVEVLEELLSNTGESIARLMKMVAPSWFALAASPACCEPSSAACGEETQACSQQALKREFRNFLQELSRRGSVILFFDDVHWADVSTVDLLAHLGQHCRNMRVLILLAHRTTELLLGPHPLHSVKLEWQGRGVCREIPLSFLSRQDIDNYLDLTFAGHRLPPDFAALVHARTEGNPLFMADLLRYLREQGVIAEQDGCWRLARELPDLPRELPESVRSMIQRKINRLSKEDNRLLAAASVQGQEFDSTVVADALELDAAEVEERLQTLDRIHGLVRLVREQEFPDHTLTLRYRFVHVLYQQALHDGLPPSRRATLGAALAQALQRHHNADSPTAAAELACLYETGRDFGQAAHQLQLAAQHASRVFAHHEALALARRGLRLLGALPPNAERAALELPLQVTLGLQLQVTQGFAVPQVRLAYERAHALCALVPEAPKFPVLWGLWLFHKVRSQLAKASEMAGELLELAHQLNDPALSLQAQQALAVTTLCQGKPAATLRHMEQASLLYDPNRHQTHSSQFGQDPGVACKAFGAVALWLLGYPDEAERQSAEAVRLSNELAQPSSQALAFHFAGMLYQCRGDVDRVLACIDSSQAIAAEHGFSFWLAGAIILRGWALARMGKADEGISLLRQGLNDWQATGSVTYRTYYLGLLAEVLGKNGQIEEGLNVVAEALDLVRKTGEGLYQAELHRLRGELLLTNETQPDETTQQKAETAFRQALSVARAQEANSLQLRSAMSLARFRPDAEAKTLLGDTLAWFKEGFQTPDLTEARVLLHSLS